MGRNLFIPSDKWELLSRHAFVAELLNDEAIRVSALKDFHRESTKEKLINTPAKKIG